MSAYALSALEIVSALGSNPTEIAERLFAPAASRLTKHRLRTTGAIVPVGAILYPLPPPPVGCEDYGCRANAIALAAFRQIEQSVNEARARRGPDRIGVVIGSSAGGIGASEEAFYHWRETGALPAGYNYQKQHAMGAAAEFIARVARVTGPAYVISTACSSGAKALASAQALMDLDICDAVIAGGVDALCDTTLNGFEALGALSRAISNPMSAARDGLNIGEGATLFLLTRDDGPIRLLGVGETSDAYHISAPEPNGAAAEIAMLQALAAAGITAQEIHYINLHGTGTSQNDAMEAAVTRRLFGEAPASSSKPQIGHCLGAAGAIELGLCWLALNHSNSQGIPLPPHCWDNSPDEKIPALNLVKIGSHRPDGPAYILSNSFAFGGSNCAVIIGKSTPHKPKNIFPAAPMTVRAWATWPPDLGATLAWQKDFADNIPACKQVPLLIRRRCGNLSRMLLETALQACERAGINPATVRHIHYSRHGEIAAMRQILEALDKKMPLSPALFSNSSHHTAPAYFDLHTQNTCLSRTMTMDESSLAFTLLEVEGLLAADPSSPVLLTLADEPPPPPFQAASPPIPYAAAFIVGPGAGPQFRRIRDDNKNSNPPGDPILELITFLTNKSPALQLPDSPHTFLWDQ